MRIGIDGDALTIKFACGTREYAYNLLTSLGKIDITNEYFIFASEDIIIPKQSNFTLVKIPNRFPVLKRQLFLPYAIRVYKIDIMHLLHPYSSVLIFHPKIITTIHDVNLAKILKDLNDIKYFLKYLYYLGTRFFTIGHSHTLVCVSDTTRQELEQKFRNCKNIVTIYSGINSTFFTLKKKVLRKKRRVILAMADYSPRKNILNVLKSYSILPIRHREKYRLIIIMSTVEPYKKIFKLIQELELESFIEIKIGISENELRDLYSTSTMFIYPSLYEGFGFPILEAMACGCPVITSNYGAMKEIAGNSSLLVDPMNVADISRSMMLLIEDKFLRTLLIKKGILHSKVFTWNAAAENTLHIYEKVFRT